MYVLLGPWIFIYQELVFQFWAESYLRLWIKVSFHNWMQNQPKNWQSVFVNGTLFWLPMQWSTLLQIVLRIRFLNCVKHELCWMYIKKFKLKALQTCWEDLIYNYCERIYSFVNKLKQNKNKNNILKQIYKAKMTKFQTF